MSDVRMEEIATAIAHGNPGDFDFAAWLAEHDRVVYRQAIEDAAKVADGVKNGLIVRDGKVRESIMLVHRNDVAAAIRALVPRGDVEDETPTHNHTNGSQS